MPKEVEECVQSVLEDNPSYTEERAFAICNAMQNRGELSLGDNPSHDDLLLALADQENECPEGQVRAGDQCVPVEEVTDVPPSSLKHSSPVFQLSSLETQPIEREELGDDRVAYRNVKLLQAGTWTDAASKQTVWYSPEGISNLEATEDNVVNIMHDVDNDVSAVGQIEPGSLHAEDGSLYGDIILETDSAGGQYADENLQKTLESGGAKGFGGPSVEIDEEGQVVEYNHEKGMPELKAGKLSGTGFVSNPASKPVSFARQVGERGVALSGGESGMAVYRQDASMSASDDVREAIRLEVLGRELQVDEIQDDAQAIADELDVPVGEVLEVLDPLLDMDDDDGGGEGEDVEAEDGDDEDDEEDEDDEMEMEALAERVAALEDMMDSVMAAEDVEAELSEYAKESEVESLKTELSEAKEEKAELEKRLSELEDEPEKPRSLADRDGGGDGFEPVFDDSVGQSSGW